MKNLVVLVNFNDLANPYTAQEWDYLFNQSDYSADGAVGSVRDYYDEISYGQFDMQSTIAGPVTLDHGYQYYGMYGTGYDARLIIPEALAKLDAQGFDFSTMDGDGDGAVDGLTIIHAGYGEEAGNSYYYVWSHYWTLSSPVTYDGVSLYQYHINPARRGYEYSPWTHGIVRIGVICHESGHFLGLPDLYDYGSDSEGAGEFCLMAGGSWTGHYGSWDLNEAGKIPCHMSAWCKSELGWVTPTTISATGTYSLGQAETNAVSYKLQGGFSSNEYFLVENRQGVGFDAAIPGSQRGILIWHVDENQSDNDDQTHYLVDLEEASGEQHLELNQNSGEDSDYFRSDNVTTFTGTTIPNNLSYYYSQPLGLDISNVGATAATMTFDLTGATLQTLTVQSTPEVGVAISGNYPGATNYTADVPNGATVRLDAPYMNGSLYFSRWKDGDGATLAN